MQIWLNADNAFVEFIEGRTIIFIISWFAWFSIPLIDVFPLLLMVTACHVLLAALAEVNVTLQAEIVRQDDIMEPQAGYRHKELRILRVRYLHLHRVYQQLSDALGKVDYNYG